MAVFDWKALLRQVAPVAATMLGGPLAGAMTQQISTALLGRPDGSEAELAAALASPDAAIKLRELELAAVSEQNRAAESVMSLDNADRDSARKRHASLNDATPRHLAYMTTGLVALCLFALFFLPVPKDNRDVLYLVTGQVITGWMMALAFFLGTTARSGAKDKMLLNARPL